MVSSKQTAIAVLIGLMFKGKVPPIIWDEPMMSEILEGEWGQWHGDRHDFMSKSFRCRTLERTADFMTLPHYWVRMHLQALQHESGGRVSTPLWLVQEVQILGELGKVVATTLTGTEIGRQCWLNGRASITHLVEETKSVFQQENSPV